MGLRYKCYVASNAYGLAVVVGFLRDVIYVSFLFECLSHRSAALQISIEIPTAQLGVDTRPWRFRFPKRCREG